jgi:hypothetical protein
VGRSADADPVFDELMNSTIHFPETSGFGVVFLVGHVAYRFAPRTSVKEAETRRGHELEEARVLPQTFRSG